MSSTSPSLNRNALVDAGFAGVGDDEPTLAERRKCNLNRLLCFSGLTDGSHCKLEADPCDFHESVLSLETQAEILIGAWANWFDEHGKCSNTWPRLDSFRSQVKMESDWYKVLTREDEEELARRRSHWGLGWI